MSDGPLRPQGKTTLLRCIAGLEMPDSGTVTGVPERLGFVFQEDRLCPQLDAVENVRLVTGLVTGRAGMSRRRISRRPPCGSWDWRIKGLHQRAAELSGGQRRRVSTWMTYFTWGGDGSPIFMPISSPAELAAVGKAGGGIDIHGGAV